jgi:Gas vesicle protein G
VGLITGLVTGIVTWPLAPVRGVVWVAEQVAEEAERQWSDPALVRRELDEVDRRRRDGELTEEEAARLEEELVQRLIGSGGIAGG